MTFMQSVWNAALAEKPCRHLQAFIEREHEFKLVVEEPLDLDGNLMGCAAVGALLCMASAPHGGAACMCKVQHHKTASPLKPSAEAHPLALPSCCSCSWLTSSWAAQQGMQAASALRSFFFCKTATCLPCSAAAAANGSAVPLQLLLSRHPAACTAVCSAPPPHNCGQRSHALYCLCSCMWLAHPPGHAAQTPSRHIALQNLPLPGPRFRPPLHPACMQVPA